jgi:hypothetical protein
MATFHDSAIKNQDMLALQSYVTAGGEQQKYASLAQGTVMIDLTHSNLVQRHIEMRFDLHETIGRLRERIHRQTGTPPDFQRLVIRQMGQDVGVIGPDDSKMMGFYGIENGMTIHCIDLNPHSGSAKGGYEDVSKIQKCVRREARRSEARRSEARRSEARRSEARWGEARRGEASAKKACASAAEAGSLKESVRFRGGSGARSRKARATAAEAGSRSERNEGASFCGGSGQNIGLSGGDPPKPPPLPAMSRMCSAAHLLGRAGC